MYKANNLKAILFETLRVCILLQCSCWICIVLVFIVSTQTQLSIRTRSRFFLSKSQLVVTKIHDILLLKNFERVSNCFICILCIIIESRKRFIITLSLNNFKSLETERLTFVSI